MTLIKKRDVKSYFSSKGTQGNQIHIVPTSQPDATGFSRNEPAAVDTPSAGFDQDFTTDHSSPRNPHPSAGDSKAPPDAQGSATPGVQK